MQRAQVTVINTDKLEDYFPYELFLRNLLDNEFQISKVTRDVDIED